MEAVVVSVCSVGLIAWLKRCLKLLHLRYEKERAAIDVADLLIWDVYFRRGKNDDIFRARQ